MQIARPNYSGRVTHYVVQSYRKMGKKLIAEEPMVVKDEREAIRFAEQTAMRRPAVIAFSRSGDTDTGDFDDPVCCEDTPIRWLTSIGMALARGAGAILFPTNTTSASDAG